MPDIAVGLGLAAHLAAGGRDVSFVVVPRYIQADPQLEKQLRKQPRLVESGVLLGQAGILSEDTRALLRQIITSTDRRGILGELRNSVGSVEALVAAILALFGASAAARVAPDIVAGLGSGLTRIYHGLGVGGRERLPSRQQGRETMIRRRGVDELAWIESERKEKEDVTVTVWLRSGSSVTGKLTATGSWLQLELVPDRPTARQGARPLPLDAKKVGVPLDEVELIAIHGESRAAVAPTGSS